MALERSVETSLSETLYPAKITKGVADRSLRSWFNKGVKAPDMLKYVQVNEMYLIYIPFWRFIAQGKAVAGGYSEYTEKTGNVIRNDFEELLDEDFVWTECACDTGQYGLKELWLDAGEEIPYVRGSVVAMDAGGSALDASKRGRDAVRKMIEETVAKRIDKVTFEKTFIIPKVFELVYAPVWIVHYEYKGGNFTCIVDGVKGEVLGGTAPINMTARTRLMILSMTVGGCMIGSAVALIVTANALVSEFFPIILLLLGIALTMASYPAFKEGKTFISSGTMTHVSSLRPAKRIPARLTDNEVLQRNAISLTCPVCGAEIEQPWGEVVSACCNCRTLLDITADKAVNVEFAVAKPDMLSKAALPGLEPEYIPFWCFDSTIEITDSLFTGKLDTGLPDITGRRNYYICCGTTPRYIAEPWEIDLTLRNPEFNTDDTEISLPPIVINKSTARELTEFLYLRYETEKPGILQVLRYNFAIHSEKIVYIPYYKIDGRYLPGI
ncbi:MAG TPA: hypothetical protein O0X70_00880 [Methanocorpusculum sp.]|nr:hypothetical protein [Methanocorpusculum sp.]